jgi:ribosomal-protein-alanine N-acetyltransferase
MDFGTNQIAEFPEFDFIPSFLTSNLALRQLLPGNFEQLLLHSDEDQVRLFLGANSDELWMEQMRRYHLGLSSWNNTFCHFFLFSNEQKSAIGYCGFHQIHPGHRKGELGYSLFDKQFMQRGIMTEAAEFVVGYGLDILKLIRIEAMTAPDNLPSIKILEKLGFRREGLLQKNYLKNGRAEDSVMFALLNERELSLLENEA